MTPEGLRRGDRVVWNGHPATVHDTRGTAGQRHQWLVELVFDDPRAAPVRVYVDPDHELEIPISG